MVNVYTVRACTCSWVCIRVHVGGNETPICRITKRIIICPECDYFFNEYISILLSLIKTESN